MGYTGINKAVCRFFNCYRHCIESCSQIIPCFCIAIDIGDILLKKPKLIDLLDMLAPHSYKWDDIGIALDVRPGVRQEQDQSSARDITKLSKILGSWMGTLSSPVTWKTIIDVLSKPIVDLPAAANEVKELLQTKYYSEYVREPDFVDTRTPTDLQN